MNERDERMARLRESFADALRLSRAKAAPTSFLTVVDRYGEPMASAPNSLTLTDRESQEFSVQFGKWLRDISKKMEHSTLSAAAMAIRASPEFSGQYSMFTTLTEFADWYLQRENDVLDAYIPNYIDDGFPIYTVSVFIDTCRKRKRWKKRTGKGGPKKGHH